MRGLQLSLYSKVNGPICQTSSPKKRLNPTFWADRSQSLALTSGLFLEIHVTLWHGLPVGLCADANVTKKHILDTWSVLGKRCEGQIDLVQCCYLDSPTDWHALHGSEYWPRHHWPQRKEFWEVPQGPLHWLLRFNWPIDFAEISTIHDESRRQRKELQTRRIKTENKERTFFYFLHKIRTTETYFHFMDLELLKKKVFQLLFAA